MHVFEIVVAMLLAGALLAALARRLMTPYPALVALAGAGLALVPGLPELHLDPELALTLFVAPVLLDAAFDSSLRDLRANWRPVASLALGAVVLTVAAVAVLARMLVPDMPWAAAIALGAIVAPPDAAAATAVLRQLRPPYRLMVILEGESLFNDASALLIYRLAVGAAVAGSLSGWTIVPTLLIVTVGSIVLGLVLARIIPAVLRNIEDVPTAVILQFCGAFGVWILAEQMHLSGILTVVAFAMGTSRITSGTTPARMRIPSFAVWEVAVFVLNVLAFILVGFQLKPIIANIDPVTLGQYVWIATAICIVTVVARIVWVTLAAKVSRLRYRSILNPPDERAVNLSWRAAAVVGWCGMRGTVTLAAALALPSGGEEGAAFPYRDLILFTAFAVVLGTLVVQGMTLRPLMQWLQLRDDGSVEHEVHLARVETLRAGLAAMAAERYDHETAALLRQKYNLLLRRAEADLARDAQDGADGQDGWQTDDDDPQVVLTTTNAERQRLLALRADGTISDAAFQQVEQELDWKELNSQQLVRTPVEG